MFQINVSETQLSTSTSTCDAQCQSCGQTVTETLQHSLLDLGSMGEVTTEPSENRNRKRKARYPQPHPTEQNV